MDEMNSLGGVLPNGIHPCPVPVVHVEVCQKSLSAAPSSAVGERVKALFNVCPPKMNSSIHMTQFDDPYLQEHVDSVLVDLCVLHNDLSDLDCSNVSMKIHVYRLHTDGPAQEELEGEDLAAANHWLLPAIDFHGMWENLIFDSDVKSQLLQYVSTTLLFSDKNVDHNVISWNRVVLLHGPPGTGKTSLCKALAQKLCIQMSDRYSYGQLIEINSHSLFSKWFSESGKLVMKMFQKIQELIDDRDALVCVLIDEVESLTAARKASLSGSEPSDAIRVVNALLTQLDQIKKNPNVIILTTSNITGAIDLAFVDRADIKQYIGPPTSPAIYRIYQSCIAELMKTGIIHPKVPFHELNMLKVLGVSGVETSATNRIIKLNEIAMKSEGLSGRTLRKLPFIAHALFVQKPQVSVMEFLEALSKAVDKQFTERQDLCKD